MSETQIDQALEHVRAAAALLEISPRGGYEWITHERPRSAVQRAADDEIDKLDLSVELPGWTEPRGA